MKKIGLIVLVAFIVAVGVFFFTTILQSKEDYPKLANYWTSPTMSPDEAIDLAKFDLVIVDMENLNNNPESLHILRRKNPRIVMLVYINPMEFFYPMVDKRPFQKELLDMVESRYAEWWLTQPDGSPVVFYPGMRMMNQSTLCPVIDRYRWNTFSAKYYIKHVFKNSRGIHWDGVFEDNSGGNIHWVGDYGTNMGIDADRDGKPDELSVLDSAWLAGKVEFYGLIKKSMGDDFIIVGNKGSVEYDPSLVSGKMFEHFPNDYLGDKSDGGWHQCIWNYHSTGPYSIIQAQRAVGNCEYRRFVLASALMRDGYYAYAQNVTNWFDEYRTVGYPLNQMTEAGDCFERRFSRATVRVCPANQTSEFIYAGE